MGIWQVAGLKEVPQPEKFIAITLDLLKFRKKSDLPFDTLTGAIFRLDENLKKNKIDEANLHS